LHFFDEKSVTTPVELIAGAEFNGVNESGVVETMPRQAQASPERYAGQMSTEIKY
jgi:hypothetical protein